MTVPAALVKAPPAIEYWPLVMLIGAAMLMPKTVITVDVTFAPNAASVTAVKSKASGVVSAGARLEIALLATMLVELFEVRLLTASY